MPSVWYLVTYHTGGREPDKVAYYWKQYKICAIGTGPAIRTIYRELQGTPLETFKSMKKGDLVLAYIKNNTIAYVGYIKDDEVVKNQKNIVGNYRNGYGYPIQRNVDWWDEPHHFDRSQFPQHIKDQMGQINVVIRRIDLGSWSFSDFIEYLKSSRVKTGTGLDDFDENLIKAGIRKHLGVDISQLEKGLIIESYEIPLGPSDRTDFLGHDENGRTVIIECKGKAYEDSIEQILRYGRSRRKDNPRLMLIAFDFDDFCISAAKKNSIELVKCDLSFLRL
jgi:hypothetical protein